eukprot:TRINITY_DN36129_c0_g1_i1.p1 TRINITY_DN36129_c0_g1~~TRINITY_DN36129_c0_g1_i1.p1  ORF type:complete len:446 (-),score=89.28 TRINITY_DN36129_c0_g1_i1:16-1353(-)
MAKAQKDVKEATSYGSVESSSGEPEKTERLQLFASGCSNFSIQYNFQSASIALAVMATHNDSIVSNASLADFPTLPWVDNTLLAVVFVGSITGMLCMGYLGDLIGCHRALLFTKGLAALGALLCALLPRGPLSAFWSELAFGRLLLGIGLGGAYPLSASCAASAENAAWAFLWQAPGAVAPYVLTLLLDLLMPHASGVTSTQFRLVLGLGAVPALIALAATWGSLQRPRSEQRQELSSGLQKALARPELQRKLLGTAGTWFLFDVAAYGTVIFTPRILQHVFGAEQSLADLVLHSIVLLSIAVPATYLANLMLPHLGARALNTLGFMSNSLIFGVFAVTYRFSPESHGVLFVILCCLSFSLNWGPCVATFVLPVEVFPPEFRSTFHGLSAAAGKLGALAGAFLFPILDSAFGVPTVMGLQAFVCALGAVVSHSCLGASAASPQQS